MRAGDVDARGRRGTIAHPDDPDECLPEYDDKDVLPRYQDVQRADARAGFPGAGAGAEREEGMEGRSPNRAGDAETGDTIPLVTRMRLNSSATLDEGHIPGLSSSGSHEGHEM